MIQRAFQFQSGLDCISLRPTQSPPREGEFSAGTGPPSLLVTYSEPISRLPVRQLAADSLGHEASHWLIQHLVKRPRPSTSPPHPQAPGPDSGPPSPTPDFCR